MTVKREPAVPTLTFMNVAQTHQAGIPAVTFRDADPLCLLNITLEHGDDDNDNGELPGLRDDEEKDMSNKLLALFSPRMRANLAPEIRGVWISESGEILHTTTDEQIVPFGRPYLPSVAEYGL